MSLFLMVFLHLRSVIKKTKITVTLFLFTCLLLQILGFLKAYLYSRRHLFDPNDILYVNCKDDDLGNALQVDRFHYKEVR